MIAAGIAGCSDPTGPSSLFGTFELQSIDGARLPESSYLGVVIQGSLTIRSDSTFSESFTLLSGDTTTTSGHILAMGRRHDGTDTVLVMAHFDSYYAIPPPAYAVVYATRPGVEVIHQVNSKPWSLQYSRR